MEKYITFSAKTKNLLLLRKGVYLYEDMDNWEKFDETTIPPKEAFYSKLNLKGISDAPYAHVQKVWEVFKIKNHGEYHDLYAQSDTLLLSDLFEKFRDKCNEKEARLLKKDRNKIKNSNRL